MSKWKIAALALAVTLTVASGLLWLDHNWKATPVFTDEIPEKRPPRLDQKQLQRFAEQTIPEIITTLQAEHALRQSAEPALPPDNAALPAMVAPTIVAESDSFAPRIEAHPLDLVGPFAVGQFDGDVGLEIISSGGRVISKISSSGELSSAPLPGVLPGDELVPADYNRDGSLDLFVVRGGGYPNSLLRNDGTGNFTDVTLEAGLISFSDTTTASWLDYDADGILDLLVGSHDHPLELYRQTGTGIFQPIAWDLGLWVPRQVTTIGTADLDQDGWSDIYLGIEGGPDRLLRFRPAEVWNESRYMEFQAAFPPPTTSSAARPGFVDFDNDGDLDLMLCTSQSGLLSLIINQGAEGLVARVSDPDVDTVPLQPAVAACFLDFDLDGHDDLTTAAPTFQRALWNREGLTFRDVSKIGGISALAGASRLMPGDLDRDGLPDLLQEGADGTLFWSEWTVPDAHWLGLDLIGFPTNLRIEITTLDNDEVLRTIRRNVSDSKQLLIGLGAASQVRSLSIFSASQDTPLVSLTDLTGNQYLKLRPGSESANDGN
jgi:FG-GAP-like repeat